MSDIIEVTDALRRSWRGGDVALLEALEYIADHVVREGSATLANAKVYDHIESDYLLDDINCNFTDDIACYGAIRIGLAFHDAYEQLYNQLLEQGRCPSCGGEITEDGCAGDSSVWRSDCGKDWT